MRKLFFIIPLFLLGLFTAFIPASAGIDMSNDTVDIDFFYGKTCQHCAAEREFLKELSLADSDINIDMLEISKEENFEKLNNYYETYGVPEDQRMGVPVTFIENYYFIGYRDGVSDQAMRDLVENLLKGIDEGNNDIVGDISSFEDLERKITIPFVGEFNPQSASPFVISMVFGIIDGFNACAMAALAFLLAVLIGIGSRKKLIIIGSIFILTSGAIYYFFIGAWLNIFLLLPHLDIITRVVGAVIIVFGIFVLKDYFEGVICKLCEVDSRKENWFSKTQKKLMVRMQKLLSSDLPLLVVGGGVILIAAGINLVELVCSFGLPVAFTKLLTAYGLSTASYYFYLLIYVIFYMIDDLVIFLIAVFTLNLAQGSDRYIKIAKLLSGVLLIILGIIILFFPEVLGTI